MTDTTATTANTLAGPLWDAVAEATMGKVADRHRRELDQAIVTLRIATRDGDHAEAEDAMATLTALGADISKIAPIVDRMLEGGGTRPPSVTQKESDKPADCFNTAGENTILSNETQKGITFRIISNVPGELTERHVWYSWATVHALFGTLVLEGTMKAQLLATAPNKVLRHGNIFQR